MLGHRLLNLQCLRCTPILKQDVGEGLLLLLLRVLLVVNRPASMAGTEAHLAVPLAHRKQVSVL